MKEKVFFELNKSVRPPMLTTSLYKYGEIDIFLLNAVHAFESLQGADH